MLFFTACGYPEKQSVQFINEHLVLENKLVIPPLLEPRLVDGEKNFDLTIQAGETEFLPGKPAKTSGFNGSYLGPTLRASSGDKVRINVTNQLNETTTVHWHGMHLPPEMDGGPYQQIHSSETWQPHWTITNPAATLWYHPHQLGKTAEQVYQGLAGLFIIDDTQANQLNLSTTYGINDIPLVVQDRKLDSEGQLVYDHDRNNHTVTAGMLGDTILVNGTYAPYIDIPNTLVRLRLLNGSNARRYNFGFSDNRNFYQIASDGGLLESPIELSRLLLAPGERAEILVDLSSTTEPITLMSYAIIEDVPALQNAVQADLAGGTDEYQQFKILELRPTVKTDFATTIPQSLVSLARLHEATAVKTRRFKLEAFTINGNAMDHTRVDEVIKKDAIEIWELTNESLIYHPFHIHGVQFQILERNGQVPPAGEQGWKDTVVVSPEETVRIILQFTQYSDTTLPYMYHCHILEHEDMGMMGQFMVVNSMSDQINVQTFGKTSSSIQH